MLTKGTGSVQEKVSEITEMMSWRIWKKSIGISAHMERVDLEGPTVDLWS